MGGSGRWWAVIVHPVCAIKASASGGGRLLDMLNSCQGFSDGMESVRAVVSVLVQSVCGGDGSVHRRERRSGDAYSSEGVTGGGG